MKSPDRPIAYAKERHATTRMLVKLSLALRDTIGGREPDANRALILTAVIMGHAGGYPMTESEVATCVKMPRQSVHRRLGALLKSGLIVRDKGRYYLEPWRAENLPYKDRIDLILAEAFDVLGSYLAQIGRPSFRE